MSARTNILVVAMALWVCGSALGQEHDAGQDRFATCDNKGGIGFFLVDTATGQTWWAEPHRKEWVSYGTPPRAAPGPPGTYHPQENENGLGLFVLNTETGEGWWSDGTEWKSLGVPGARPPTTK